MIWDSRGVANFSLISPSSSLMTVRSRPGSARMASSSAQLGHLRFQLGTPQPGEATEGRVEDVVGLDLTELEGRRHQPLTGRRPVLGAPDQGDDGVDHVQGLDQALDDVGPGTGLLQAELRPAADDLNLVLDVGRQGLHEVEGPRDTVHQGDGVDPEAGLERGVLVQVVEQDVGVGVALDVDDEAGTTLRRFVVDVPDTVQLPGLDQVPHLGGDRAGAGLVWEFGDHDGGSALGLLDLRLGPHPHRAPPGPVGVHDPGPSQEQGPGREVGTLDELHQVVRSGLGVVNEVDDGVDDLTEVVGRDVGGHPHGNALAPVDQQVREPGGKDDRLLHLPRVVFGKVNGVLVDPRQHLHGQRRQPAFRVVVDEAAGQEGVVVGVDPEREDLLGFLVGHGGHPGEPVPGVHDGQDHLQDFGVLDSVDDPQALGLPPLDAIEAVLDEPSPAGPAAAGSQRGPDIVGDVRDVVLR